MKWSVVYKKAYNQDGSLFYPEKLSQEFLENAKRTMGSYLFANQYLNEITPAEEQIFKPHWVKYYDHIPIVDGKRIELKTFAMIDPAIGQQDNNDYTGITVIHTSVEGHWYVDVAMRVRLTPTEIVNKVFEINNIYKPDVIGIEVVAFQKILLYLFDEEMRKRKVQLPLKGVTPGNDKTKEMRISALAPRFEWGNISIKRNMFDLENELYTFPRSSHDDILDSLALQNFIVSYPLIAKDANERPSPNAPNYESWYIRNLRRREED